MSRHVSFLSPPQNKITDEVMEYVIPKFGKCDWREDNSWSRSILKDIYNTFYKDEAKAVEEAELAKESEDMALSIIKAMPSYFHKKLRWVTVFATGRRSFIEPGTGLRMKRTNRRTRVPTGLYPCHIEEKMTIKEVRGESVMEWKTKVTTKEGIVIQFPGKFRGYKLAMEEVEENEGLKENKKKLYTSNNLTHLVIYK
ncbi:hypothetical protein Tco_1314018 [Tanacetum coccineum]